MIAKKEMYSPNVRESGFRKIFACGIRNPWNFCFESGILGFGIQNTAQGIQKTAKEWNPKTTLH